jgi:hypothetical protein
MALAQQVFTDVGIDMLGRANAGVLLTISKMVVGAGVAAVEDDIFPLTALINFKANCVIVRKTDLGGGEMLISGVLNEADLTGPPFQLRELGIMAHTGSNGGTREPSDVPGIGGSDAPVPVPEIVPDSLYCASNVFADPPDTITPGGSVTHAFDLTIKIDRATNITVVIGDAGVVDCVNIPSDATVGPGWYASRVGDVFQFKRAVAGTGMELIDGGDRVTIRQKTLQANLDLYVPTSNPNAPSPDVAFPTIQAAHDYLLGFIIPPDKFATIHVYLGTFNHTSGILFSHPNSRQISLIGEPRVEKTITSVTYVNTSNKDVVVNSSSGLITGQRVYVAVCAPAWSGGCKINTITGTTLRLSALTRSARVYSTNFTGVAWKLRYYPTVLLFTGLPVTTPALWFPNGIKSVENICVDGGDCHSCFAVESGAAVIKNVSAWNAVRGISGGAASVNIAGECSVTDCTFGITSLGPIAAFEQLYINSCDQGVLASAPGFAIGSIQAGMDTTIVYVTRCQFAGVASTGSNLRGGSWWMSTNDTGLNCQLQSIMTMNVAYPSLVENQTTDLFAQGMSYIQWDRRSQPAPICNPVAEIVGNQNSMIHLLNTAD